MRDFPEMRFGFRRILSLMLVFGLFVLPLTHAGASGAAQKVDHRQATSAVQPDCHGHATGEDFETTPDQQQDRADAPCKSCGLSHCFSVSLPSLPAQIDGRLKPLWLSEVYASHPMISPRMPAEPPRA